MQDVIGYNVDVKTKEIVTSEYAILSSDDGSKTSLVQQVNIQFGHRVETRYESGSSTVYMVNGQPSGQMSVARLVGKYGFLDASTMGTSSGVEIRTFHVGIDETKINILGTDSLTIQGAMFLNAAISYGMGGMEVGESANYMFVTLARSGGSGNFLKTLTKNVASAAVNAAKSTVQDAVARAI